MWFILYLLIGIGLGFLFRKEDDTFTILDPMLAFVVIVAWPGLVIYFACKATRLKYKGKTIWERKR